MLKIILITTVIITTCCFSGCIPQLSAERKNRVAQAYDKYHPTYGSRNELPEKEYEVTAEQESIWQRPPNRVTVYQTPDGPETGPHGRAAITDDYIGYQASDIPVLQQELGAPTDNLTTRDPVKQLPDYLRADYGSRVHK